VAVDRCTLDLANGRLRHAVLADYLEAHAVGVTSVPTVILADHQGAIRVVGEVPLGQYRRYIERLLAM
jgi:predicted DsbA family dithiol-disulfide isomerase